MICCSVLWQEELMQINRMISSKQVILGDIFSLEIRVWQIQNKQKGLFF